jgi:anti-sigma B factor antagonist
MSETVLKTDEADGVLIVSFQDASILDTLTIQKIGRELFEIVETQAKRKVILDFGEVRFLSSMALGVLLTLRRKADKAGAAIALTRVRDELARVFEITNLDKLFQFFNTNEEAVAHLAAAPSSSG